MPFSLPHWNYGEDRDERIRRVHENFEELASQTERQIADSFVHEPEEAAAVVSTASLVYVSLSGGPSITVSCRAGLLIGALVACDAKNDVGGNSADFGFSVDGGAAVYGAGTVSSTTYAAGFGGFEVYPASATSHTFAMKYRADSAGTASYQNRRIWAWVL